MAFFTIFCNILVVVLLAGRRTLGNSDRNLYWSNTDCNRDKIIKNLERVCANYGDSGHSTSSNVKRQVSQYVPIIPGGEYRMLVNGRNGSPMPLRRIDHNMDSQFTNSADTGIEGLRALLKAMLQSNQRLTPPSYPPSYPSYAPPLGAPWGPFYNYPPPLGGSFLVDPFPRWRRTVRLAALVSKCCAKDGCNTADYVEVDRRYGICP